MAGSRSRIGIQLDLDATGAIRNAKALGDALDDTADAAGKLDGAIDGATVETVEFNEGLQNTIMGLQTVQQHLGMVSDFAKNQLSSAVDASAEFETAMARVEIVMGKTGARAQDAGLVEEFEKIRSKIMQIGRDTEFSMPQAAEAFIALKSAGLSANEALSVIDKTMALSSASAGAVSLAEAADTVTLSMSAMNVGVGEANEVIDQMVKIQSMTKAQLQEFPQMFISMRAAAQDFGQSSKEEFLAVASVLRDMGLTPGVVGQSIENLGGEISGLLKVIKKGKGERFDALRALGLDKDTFVDAQGRRRGMMAIVNDMNEKIMASNEKVGEAETARMLKQVVQMKQARNIFALTAAFQRQKGRTLIDVMNEITSANGEAMDAQATALDTYDGKMQILGGSINLLKVTIGDFLEDAVQPTIDAFIMITNMVTTFAQENPEVVKSVIAGTVAFLGFVSVLSTLVGALILVDTAMAILGPVAVAAGSGMTLAGIAAGFLETTLLPLITLLAPAVIMLAKLAAVGTVLWLAYQANLGGLKTFMQGWVKDLQSLMGVILPLLSGEGIDPAKWDALSPRVKKMAVELVKLKTRAIEFGKGFIEGVKVPLAVLNTVIIEPLIVALTVLGKIFEFITVDILGFGEGAEKTGDNMRVLGQVVGFVAAAFVVYKFAVAAVQAVLFAVRTAQIAWTGAMLVSKLVMSSMNLASFITMLGTLATAAFPAATAAATAFSTALSANPIGVIIIAILILIVVIAEVIIFWDDLVRSFDFVNDAVLELTDGFAGLYDLWKVTPIGWIIMLVMWLTDVLPDAVDSVGGFFVAMWKNMEEVVIGFIELVVGVFDDFVRSMDFVVDTVVSFFVDGFNTIRDTFMANPLVEAGTSLISGLLTGMKTQWQEVEGFLLEKSDWVTGLWPFSPAKHGPLAEKPMERAGANIIRMLREGMATEIGPLEVTGNSVAQTVVNAVAQTPAGQIAQGLASQAAPLVRGAAAEVEGGRGSATAQAAAVDRSGGGGPVQGGGEKQTNIHVNAEITTGDFKLSPQSLTGAEARQFMEFLSEAFGSIIEEEFRKRNLAGA